MNNELVPDNFFAAEAASGEENEIIISAEWMALSDEDFEQEAVRHHTELNQQEAVIDALKNRVIHEKGALYIAAKARLKHGSYLKLLERMGVDPRTAQEYAQAVRELGEELLNARRVAHLGFRQWIRIARSPESHQIVAKLEAGDIEATPQAINTELEAAKKRTEEAEKAKQHAEAQLSLFREQAQSQIIDLQDALAASTTPKVEIRKVEVIPAETTAQLQKLEAQVTTLTRQKENLARLNEELSADLDANEERDEREARELRIRKAWTDATSALYKALHAFVEQLPLPCDTQVFDSEDWTRLGEVEARLQYTMGALGDLRKVIISQFIESSVVETEEGTIGSD